MNFEYATPLLGYIVILILLISGLYLAFSKRKRNINEESKEAGNLAYVNQLKVTDAAKAVFLKELTQQTANKFTKKWFLEYWHGNRTLFYAWWTWSVMLGIVAKIVSGLLGMLSGIIYMLIVRLLTGHLLPVKESLSIQYNFMTYVISDFVLIFYCIIAWIILWRCAKNSTPFYHYFAKFWVVLSIILLFLSRVMNF